MAATPIPENAKIRKFTQERLDKIVGIIEHDDNHKPDTINIVRGKAKYAIHNPDDPQDPIELREFYGVLLFGKQIFVSPNDDSDSTEKVEKRVCSVLRFSNGLPMGPKDARNPDYMAGTLYPEAMWISPTGLTNYKKLFREAKEKYHLPFNALLIKFGLELATSKDGKYKWGKPVFTVIRALTEEELAIVQPMIAATKAQDDRRSVDDTLDDYEEEATGQTLKRRAPKDDEDEATAGAKKARRKDEIEEDDEEEKPKTAKGKATAKPAAAKPKPAPAASTEDDEDEEEQVDVKAPPTKAERQKAERELKAATAPDDDDDEEDGEPATKPAKGKPAPAPADDDEDEEED